MRTSLVVLLALLAAGGAACAGAEWPQWGGRDERNMVSEEKGLPVSFDPGKKKPGSTERDPATARNIRWSARLGKETFTSPVVGGGRVLIGTNHSAFDPKYEGDRGVLLCFDEATGKFLWQLNVPRDPAQKNLAHGQQLGLCSTPTLDGNRVYVVGYRCDVLCLDLNGLANGNDGPFQDEAQYFAGAGKDPVPLSATDADILWRYDMPRELHVSPHDACACSILVRGDLLYVCTGNGVNQQHKVSDAPLAPSLIVLNKKTGALVAQDHEKIGTRVFHGQWSSPSLGLVNGQAQLLFGAGDGLCYGFCPAPVSDNAGPAGTLAKLWSFDANGGNKNRYKTEDGPSEIIATPVCWKNHVYVDVGQDWTRGPGKGLLSCIDATLTGDVSTRGKVWSYGQIGRSVSTVSVADGLVYAGDTNGKVHCLDAETGACYWVFDAEAPLWNSTLVADGKVYVGNSKGKCFILAAGKQKTQLGSANFGEPMAGSFVATNGSLYVATYTHLYAIQALK